MKAESCQKALSFTIVAVAFVSVFAITVVFGEEVESETTIIELQREDGSVITSSLLDGSVFPFSTKTLSDGSIEYSIMSNAEVEMLPAYLVIRSDLDRYNLTIRATGAEDSFLIHTGIVIHLFDGKDGFSTMLKTDLFEGVTMNGSVPAVLHKDVRYRVSVAPAIDYTGPLVSTSATDVVFTFMVAPAEEWRELSFISDGALIEKTLKRVDETVGQLPSVSKQGYDLRGWFCGGTQVYESSLVGSLKSDIIEARWTGGPSPHPSPNPRPPDPVPPDGPVILETSNEETNGENIIETIHTVIEYEDGSQLEMETVLVMDMDRNLIEGSAHSVYTEGGQTIYVLDARSVDGRTVVTVPVVNRTTVRLAEDTAMHLETGGLIICVLDENGYVIIEEEAVNDMALREMGLMAYDKVQSIMLDRQIIKSSSALEGDLVLRLAHADRDDMTPEQLQAIAQNYSVISTLSKGQNDIHILEGFAEIEVNKTDDHIGVNFVDSDGSKEPVEFTYQDGKVRFTVEHLSIYMITDDRFGSERNSDSLYIILAIVVSISVMVSIIIIWRGKA